MGKNLNLFGRSKRQRLVYIVLVIWIGFGVAGFALNTDFSKLATYFGVFATNAMMYLWGETKRPHELEKE